MKKRKKKSLKRKLISLGISAAVLSALFVFLVVWYFGAGYPAFYAVARAEFTVPALHESISPQGLCALPEDCAYDFAVSGYMTDKTPSRVYLVDAETSANKYVTVAQNGVPLTAHFGGITCTGNYLLVASGKEIVRVALSAALEAENGGTVEVYDSFSTEIQNAFCYYSEGVLYAGEFYRAGNYETDVSHHITADGETNYAFIYAFAADESKTGGVSETVPLYALSVCGKVQGIAVTEEAIFLSTSYGLSDSKLYVYPNLPANGYTATGTAQAGGKEIPLYRLDSKNLSYELTMPCMSEEICVRGDRLYVLFESMCDKYKYFVRTRIDRVYSASLNDLTAQ